MVKKSTDIDIIIRKAKEGKDMAYTQLLNMYWKDVHRFLSQKTNDENEAEDITIRAFSRAFDKINTYDESYKFKTWLLTIANNLLIDQFRKKKTETVSIHKKENEVNKIKDNEPSPVDQLIIKQNLAKLLAYIKQLKPHYQEIINLRFFQEMSYKEMAEELNEPMSTIKVKLLRAKKLLAEIIKKSKS